jgi:hypothetical protein
MRDLIALIEKMRKEEKAAGINKPVLPDMLDLFSREGIKTAHRLSRALGHWARQLASPAFTRHDAGTAADLLALRATLDERILEFEAEQNRRRRVTALLLYPDLGPDEWIAKIKEDCDSRDRVREALLGAARRDTESLSQGSAHDNGRDRECKRIAPVPDPEEDWESDDGWHANESHDTDDDEGEPADDAWDEIKEDIDSEDELGLANLVGYDLKELPEKYKHKVRHDDGRIRCIQVHARNGYVVLMVNTDWPKWITIETGVRCK